MNRSRLMIYFERLGLVAALIVLACALAGQRAFAQTSSAARQKPAGERTGGEGREGEARRGEKAVDTATASGPASADHQLFKDIYREFYETYRLGPADEIAIRVLGQPDYSLERVKVSPTGSVYHQLLGDLEIAGLTVPRLIDQLTRDLSEYLINPKVSVTLLEANSAKIGVLGDVRAPGIVVMNRPMNVLEAITASGGFADTGSKSGVTVLRQTRDGRAQTMKVNVKRILEGKARPDENIALQAGDTVIVHGNTLKKMNTVMSLMGFGNFLLFISQRGR